MNIVLSSLKSQRKRNRRGALTATVFSVVSIFLLTACSEESAEREYSLPGTLCGISVSEKKYDPLFPPGERVSSESSNRWGLAESSRTEGCQYYVDGKGVLGISGDWRNSNDEMLAVTPSQVIRKFYDGKGEKYPGRFDAWTSKTGAAVAVECSLEKQDSLESTPDRYLLRISAGKEFDEDRDESRKVLGELAQSMMAGILPKLPCKEG